MCPYPVPFLDPHHNQQPSPLFTLDQNRFGNVGVMPCEAKYSEVIFCIVQFFAQSG